MKTLTKILNENNVKFDIHPLIIPADKLQGTIFNPSVLNDNGTLRCVIRTSNYLLHYSHKITHPLKKVSYIHPENDLRLVTFNFYGELDPRTYKLIDVHEIDTSITQNYPSVWSFVGHEDVRLVNWEDQLYVSGIRRDIKSNGESRMELCKLDDDSVHEYNRIRIPIPGEENGETSYCEKNWMPILDKPYHWVKWSNPVQVVRYDKEKHITETVHLSDKKLNIADPRGSSQLIPFNDGYLALVHSTYLWNKETKQAMDCQYTHRFLFYNKDFEVVKMSDEFTFLGFDIEFSCGMCLHNKNIIIPFSCKDSTANLLVFESKFLNNFLKNV